MRISPASRMASPPALHSQATSSITHGETPVDSVSSPRPRPQGLITKTLKIFAGAASLAAPATMSQAQDQVSVSRSVANSFQHFRNLPDLAEQNGEFPGGVSLQFRPFDLDLDPKWRDGGPALQFDADLLHTTLYQTLPDRGGMTVRGISAHLNASGYVGEEPEIGVGFAAFRSHQRELENGFQVRFDQRASLTQLLQSTYPGAYFDVGFRQEIQGGEYSAFNRDFSFYGEAEQHFRHDFRDSNNSGGYRIFAGARTDFDVQAFGRRGNVEVTVGPELEGSLFGGKPNLQLGTQFRFRRR